MARDRFAVAVTLDGMVLIVFVILTVGHHLSPYPAGLFVGGGLFITNVVLFMLPKGGAAEAGAVVPVARTSKALDRLASFCLIGSAISLLLAIADHTASYLISMGAGLLLALYLRFLANKVRNG